MEGQPVQGAAWRPGIATRAGTRGHSEGACALSDYTGRATKGYPCFMAVADGFGGEGRGDVASRLAVDAIHAAMDPNRFEGDDDFRRSAEGALSEAVEAANDVIVQAGSAPDKAGLGAVVTCAVVDSENAFIAHVGNTRAYLLTARGTRQVTSDHVEPVDGQRTRLTSALGTGAAVDADILRVPLRPGEVIFLCSHALYSALSIEQVSATLASTPDLQAACDLLVEAAAARGPVADVSIVAWRVPGDGPVTAVGAPEATQPPPPKKKRRRWLVALVALLLIAGGAAASWGVASIWFKDKSPAKKAGTTVEQPSNARFAADDLLAIDTTGKPDACYLTEYPDGPQQTRLYDGWKVRVISTRFAQGEQWYRVEVVEGGLDMAGKKGYVQESFLVE
jgi:serine/threonine protein phosphatase PrpC